jgi:cytochrome c oxidase cbb3-type subunit 1
LESSQVAVRFIQISLIYFIIGAVWMGLGPTPIMPSPSSPLGSTIYDTSRVHVMVLGWASFALIGMLYYLVPKMRGKEQIYSKKLATIHFWVTNITLPLAVVIAAYFGYVADWMENSGVSEANVPMTPPGSTLLMAFVIVFLIGLVAQLLFVYNVYKTFSS